MSILTSLTGVLILLVWIRCNVGERIVYRVSRHSDGAHSNSMPQVSAVLLECPKGPKTHIPDAHRCNKDMKETCEPHLMVKIHMNPSFHVNKVEKFLILDEVYDPQKRCKAKIMSPYLIEISRGEPVMMYPLQFSKMLKFTGNSSPKANEEEEKCKTEDKNDMNETDAENSNHVLSNEMDGKVLDETTIPLFPNLDNCCGNLDIVEGTTPKIIEYDSDDMMEGPTMSSISASNIAVARQTNTLNRDVHEIFVPVTNGLKQRTGAGVKKTKVLYTEAPQEYELKRLQDKIYAFPKSVQKNPYASNEKPLEASIPYPLKWNQHILVIPEEDDDDTNKKSKKVIYWPPHRQHEDTNPTGADNSDNLSSNTPNGRNSPKIKKSEKKDTTRNAAIRRGHAQKLNKKKQIQIHGTVHSAKQGYAPRGKYSRFGDGKQSHLLLKKQSPSNSGVAEEFVGNFLPNLQDKDSQPLASRYQSPNDINRYKEFVSKRENDFAGEVLEGINQPVNDEEEDILDPTLTASFLNDDFPRYKSKNSFKNTRDNKEWLGTKHHDLSDDDEDYLLDEQHFSPRQNNFISGSYTDFNTMTSDMKYAPSSNATDNSISDDDAFYYYLNGDHQLQLQKQIENWPNQVSFVNESNSIFDTEKKPKTLDSLMDDFAIQKLFPSYTNNVKALNASSNAYPAPPLFTPITAQLSEKPKLVNIPRNLELKPYFIVTERPQMRTQKYPSNMHGKYNLRRAKQPKARDDELYYRALTDENLNANNKMNVLNTMREIDDESFKKMASPIDDMVDGSRYVTPYPLIEQDALELQILNRNNKRKRSFLASDDMEDPERELDAENAGIYQARSAYEDGVQSCTTCGGKGKKVPPKGGLYDGFEKKDSNCQCRNVRHKDKQSQCDCSDGATTPPLSDVWYSVYNMSAPLPFLTTRMRIFRKRHGTWWRIVPSITLNSLSGIFANANLSILFSSHVDIFQLEKSLQFQDHQLLIPHSKTHNTLRKHKSTKPTQIQPNKYTILAINPKLLKSPSSKVNVSKLLRQYDAISSTKQIIDITTTVSHLSHHPEQKTGPNDKDAYSNAIQKIADFGSFPSSMNLLEHCPDDPKRLCLNILDDRVPAFNIKMKIPFRENTALAENVYKVKIAQILTDATTKDALQVFIELINEGFEAKEFSISIHNCPTCCFAGSKTTVSKLLYPRIGETITFLLPLIIEANNKLKLKKFSCQVVVMASLKDHEPMDKRMDDDGLNDLKAKLNNSSPEVASHCNMDTMDKRYASYRKHNHTIVSMREVTIEPDKRCACVWKCKCHCFSKLESSSNVNVCQEMDYKLQLNAGLLLNSHPGDINDEENDFSSVAPAVEETEQTESTTTESAAEVTNDEYTYKSLFWYILRLLTLLLYLGLIKAILGLCITCIDKCGYNYVSLTRPYKRSSRCRKFLVNVFFFIAFPFLFWCKCFTPSEEDLLIASTEWKFAKDPPAYKRTESQLSMQSQKSRTRNYTKPNSRQVNERDLRNRMLDGRSGGGYEVSSSQGISDLDLVLNVDIFDDDNADDDDCSTKDILKALIDSRESLKRLQATANDEYAGKYSNDTTNVDDWIKKLRSAQIVYRIFDHPIGDLRHIPPGYKYSIQGYFLPCIGQGYKFVNYNPLAQHRCLSVDGHTIQTIKPPIALCAKDFDRHYTNKYDVLHADDLSIVPPTDAPCLNVSVLANVASAVANIASDRSSQRSSERMGYTTQRALHDVKNLDMDYTTLDNISIESADSDNSLLEQEIAALEDEFLLPDEDDGEDDDDDENENDYSNAYRSAPIPTIPE